MIYLTPPEIGALAIETQHPPGQRANPLSSPQARRDTASYEHAFCGRKRRHFGQSRGCSEYGAVICPGAAAEQPGRDISLKVLGHARVQVPPTDLQISRPEGLHGGGVRITERTGADWYQLKRRARRFRNWRSAWHASGQADGRCDRSPLARQFEPQPFWRDAQDACPVSQRVEIADRRPVLDTADLRLSESEPGTEKFLRNAIAAIFRDVERVSAVRPRDMAHVLSIKGVTKGRCLPEAVRYCGRFGALLQRPPLTGAALRARVVARQPLAALAVARGASTHQGSACPVWAPKRT